MRVVFVIETMIRPLYFECLSTELGIDWHG